MSNDDKRRRMDGSTAKLSVADLISRREAETQPIPRITEDVEETVRFAAPTNLSGRELHITELLKREGRAGEEERGGGFSVPKLVAMAGGGVVLAGTVAFTATNLLSSPTERPLAEVRYDERPAARSTNTVGNDLAAAAAKQQAAQAQEAPAEAETTTPSQTTPQRAPRTQQPAPTTTTPEQAPTTTTPAQSSAPQQTTPTTTTPPAAPTTSEPSASSTPPSTDPSTPPSEDKDKGGISVGIDLGGILEPIGGFDFFASEN